MIVHLISDLHLDPRQPSISRLFLDYLNRSARAADQLYILGDLFELWTGDDIAAHDYAEELSAIRAVADAGVDIRFLPGNRDFLCGERFAQRCGLTIVKEPVSLRLPDGRPAALLHGDVLCTDDTGYQRFRRIVRHPIVQALYFALPRSLRQRLARKLRSGASRAMSRKPTPIMDVNAGAVSRIFDDLECEVLIHGHTHRPDTHRDGAGRERWVLADWKPAAGEVLVADTDGLHRVALH